MASLNTTYQVIPELEVQKWDHRFLAVAAMVASWSKDPSTQAGAVIVRPDKTIASVGFNGFARTMSDAPDLYADREQKYSRVIHCEVNALISSRDMSVQDYTLYTHPFMCCDRCVVQMIQAGIKRFVFTKAPDDQASRWEETFVKTRAYMDEAECTWTQYPV